MKKIKHREKNSENLKEKNGEKGQKRGKKLKLKKK